MNRLLGTLLAGAALLVGGCAESVTGRYVDTNGVSTFVFEPDGRARISALGADVFAEYRVDGDRVIVASPQGTLVLTIRGDRLTGPMGLDLVRQPSTEEP